MASLIGIPMNKFSEVFRYAALLLTVITGSQFTHSSSCLMAQTKQYRVATFAADVTPPQGNPLCGGLVKPVEGVSEPLQALGIVLFGSEQPIVLCAVDWCEVHNRDHGLWRERLAEAAGTTPDRVAVQCLHQHNAPIADSAVKQMLVEKLLWCTKSVFLSPNPDFNEEQIRQTINDDKTSVGVRIAAAMKLSWMKYASKETPIVFSCLHLNDAVRILHLPGEPFVEYQLFAQQENAGKFVAVMRW